MTVKRSSTTGLTFYLDNQPPQQTSPTSFPGSVTPAANYPLNVGTRFNGCIDEVELFNRELAPAEIAAIYNAGRFGKCKTNPCPDCPIPIQIVQAGTNVVLSWPAEAANFVLEATNSLSPPIVWDARGRGGPGGGRATLRHGPDRPCATFLPPARARRAVTSEF